MVCNSPVTHHHGTMILLPLSIRIDRHGDQGVDIEVRDDSTERPLQIFLSHEQSPTLAVVLAKVAEIMGTGSVDSNLAELDAAILAAPDPVETGELTDEERRLLEEGK